MLQSCKFKMKPLLLIFFVCLFMSAAAEVNDWYLSERQCSVLQQWIHTDSLDNTGIKLLAQKDTTFSRVKQADCNQIIDIISPANKQIYQQYDTIYQLCAKLAQIIILNPPAEVSQLWNTQEMMQAAYGKHNLSAYLQQQLFDFYYNNKVLSYLQNPEYIALLQPRPLVKLLSDTKGKAILQQEILFLKNNSTCKIY